MTGMTDFITEADWDEILTVWYVLVDDAYKTLEQRLGRWRTRGPQPAFSDSEVITVALFIDTVYHGNEELGLHFVRQHYRALFPKLLPNGQFNYRRRLLCRITDLIRRWLIVQWELISESDRLRLLDSAPISLCTDTRGKENQTASGSEHFGRCVSKGTQYFGVKLCLTTSSELVVDRWLLAAAAHHDSDLTGTMLEDLVDRQVLSEGAFHKPDVEERAALRNVELLALPRKDSRTPWPSPLRQLVGKLRRRIETSLSVLETVFHIERPGSRATDGLVARIATRLLAYTLCFITQPLLIALANPLTPS